MFWAAENFHRHRWVSISLPPVFIPFVGDDFARGSYDRFLVSLNSFSLLRLSSPMQCPILLSTRRSSMFCFFPVTFSPLPLSAEDLVWTFSHRGVPSCFFFCSRSFFVARSPHWNFFPELFTDWFGCYLTAYCPYHPAYFSCFTILPLVSPFMSLKREIAPHFSLGRVPPLLFPPRDPPHLIFLFS